MKHLFLICALAGFARPAHALVKTKTIEYKQGETALEGYLAYPDKKGKLPAIVVVHDWMGVTESTKSRARMLAGLGYVALAADIYGKGVRPTNADEASKLASQYKNDRNLLRERVKAAYDELAKQPNVNPTKMAAMGYCFGGTTALELARSGADLVGTLTFHGGLSTPTPADAKNIKGRVLALHGANDPFVNEKEVSDFQKEMRDANIDWQMVAYGGAVHSFTIKEAGDDPTKGAAYNEKADKRSWEEMKRFFTEVF